MKSAILCVTVIAIVFLCGCTRQIVTEPVYRFTPPTEKVGYVDDVKPILEKRCVVCHSCYNSPCQLKFSSWEGLDRGASKERVYNADRLSTMEPSRLFVDAQTSGQWREKGFYSIKSEEGSREYEDSIIFMLLDHKRKSPSLLTTCDDEEKFKAEAEDLTCPQTTAEVNDFLKTHPNRGMPFGFPPLTQEEFDTVVGWLTQGAPGPTDEEQNKLKNIPDADKRWIARWETFLNTEDTKHRLTARYVYEHLFLAHIHFQPDSEVFYELVRSRTPPGKPIDIIATRRPYDDPGTTDYYYRFRKIHSTIVHKTHMVFTMDKVQFDRVHELFIQSEWDAGPYRLEFDPVISANPFESFERIPVRSRYEWLLDNAHYFIMTFIRGPVCKGQVALNVINDQFWLLFIDPAYDVSVKHPEFLSKYKKKLRMPKEQGNGLVRLFKSISLMKHRYGPWAKEYYTARQLKYQSAYPKGLGAEAIWIDKRAEKYMRERGEAMAGLPEREQQQAMLTVFRHFDSASVHRGAWGKLPRTAWVVDYPVLERIYYSLVAGFDVYGTKGHQGTTRKYMDSLRIEAESLFLEFMPPQLRKQMMADWYQNLRSKDDLYYFPTDILAKFPFTLTDYTSGVPFKREFLEHIADKLNIDFDQNYITQNEDHSSLPESYGGFSDWVRGFQAVSAKEKSFLKRVDSHNANVAWVRVERKVGKDAFFSVIVDRWHDNVHYYDREKDYFDKTKDVADVISGLYGSYPNYFFEVKEDEMARFIQILYEYDGADGDVCRLESYGVNRSEPKFWAVYDRFQKEYDRQHGERKGIIDLNRYYSLAMNKALYEGGSWEKCEAIAKEREENRPWWHKYLEL